VWSKRDEIEVEVKVDKKMKYGLRQIIAFSSWFYYWAIVSDLVLRLTWCISVPLNPVDYPWVRSVKYATFIALLELFRRWQWSLLRIENEQVNNLEKYRIILEVPEVRPVHDLNEEENMHNEFREKLKKVN